MAAEEIEDEVPPMTRTRSLLWLIALVAFVMPSLGVASMAPATAPATVPVERTGSVECAEHAPPPDPCPAEGTARHAAGDCCPLMGAALALLPATVGAAAALPFHARVAPRVHSLVGRIFTKDPPPPRV
jgi:hypothetical protein